MISHVMSAPGVVFLRRLSHAKRGKTFCVTQQREGKNSENVSFCDRFFREFFAEPKKLHQDAFFPGAAIRADDPSLQPYFPQTFRFTNVKSFFFPGKLWKIKKKVFGLRGLKCNPLLCEK